MRMRTVVLLVAAVAAGLMLLAVTATRAGVPFAEPGPTTCTATNSKSESYTISITPDSVTGEWPVRILSGGQTYTLFNYSVTSTNVSQLSNVDIVVSADLAVNSSLSGFGTVKIYDPGAGDNVGFLAYAQHEYPVRISANNFQQGGTPLRIAIVGPASPRLSTAFFQHGNLLSSCLIQGPGVAGDVFQPVFQEQIALAAGGKCQVKLIFNSLGQVVEVQALTPGCDVITGDVTINGALLRNNTSPHGITYGNGTCTTYGPPVPSPPRTVLISGTSC